MVVLDSEAHDLVAMRATISPVSDLLEPLSDLQPRVGASRGNSPADAKARSSERFRLAVEAFVAALVDLPSPASTGSHAFS